MAATNNNNGDGRVFGDIDKHQLKQGVFTRLLAVLKGLQLYYQGDYGFLRKLQEFIPQLKRTDKDYGSLPFYAKGYASPKANRDHCILCLISKAVQDYWDFADDTIGDAELVAFFYQIGILEAITGAGLTGYRVTGTPPAFYLDTIQNIEKALQAVDKAEEIDAAEQTQIEEDQREQLKHDEEDAANPTGNGQDTSDLEELSSTDVEGETGDDDTADASSNDNPDAPATQAEPKDQATGSDNDQLPVELADKCSGDCDTCEDKVCEIDEAKDIPPAPDDENVQYPDVEDLS